MAATINCKHCGAAIPAENISDGELAICDFCAALNNLSHEPIPLPEKPKAKSNFWIPEKLSYQQHAEGVEIRYRWFVPHYWGLLFFSLFWNGIMFFMVSMMIASGEFAELLCISLHFFIGLGVGYYTLLGFFNRTTIMIRERGIGIKTRPLPAINYADKQIDRRAIEQVYVKRRHAGDVNDKPYYEFDVHYLEKGKSDAILVRGVRTYEEALFIEQQIENLYQIEDEPYNAEWASQPSDNDKLKSLHKHKNQSAKKG